MRNVLFGFAAALFVIALLFATQAQPYFPDVNASDTPNVLAALSALGFALAGGAALIATAIVHCFDRFEGDRPDERP
jgi:hypothetical protein